VAPGVFEYGFDTVVTDRVPKMLITLASIWAVQILIGFIMISDFQRRATVVNEDDWEDVQRVRLEELARKAPLK
jgi:hypothetical protein